MKQNKVIAVTGGIGSGKSTVCKIIKQLGYVIFNCDEIYSQLLDEGVFNKTFIEEFGKEVFLLNGSLNRKYLAKIVFNDKNKLKRLNEITHRPIIERCIKLCKDTNQIAFVEVQLLFEGNLEQLFDKVIVVTKDLEKRIGCIRNRDNLTREEALSRINYQINYDLLDLTKYYVIDNNGDLEQLKQNVTTLLVSLTK